MSDRFTGRTVVVTGAGSGIGRATVVRLHAEGATVVATDVAGDRLVALAADLPGDRLRTVTGDVAEDATVEAVVAAADGRLDGLANVAGIMDGFLPAGEVDDATWDLVLRVNLTAPQKLVRAALPLLLDGGGAIVNVASEAALRGSAAGAAYTASKHGLVGLTRHVAFAYGPQGVRANVVAPGPVVTGITGEMRSALGAARSGPVLQAVGLVPVGPEHLASAITWLLSDESANVNGAVLPSDGGWSVV
ncbi:SDR family NAD(P)-dependent oxidoreductase [Cellulomonas triticagri]|uniref:SDR family oxidoreductase n=1 Tax=Cellulomonas triticagri TaxID=2483352 RepID=A0A3M2IUP8_9CELL|nr:SDR family oxidoreductase [Cellulomonas triticagri]RMI04839.1 SDR family oxidoreductase [Cellulomonas triticagri]